MKHSKIQIVLTNVAIFLVLALLFASTLYTNAETAFVSKNTALYSGNREGNSVTLMFNVYQGSEYIEEIMTAFKTYGFNTTFFIGGIWAEKNPELVKKMSDEGFEIANHGYLHRDADKLSVSRNREEIEITERLIETITGKPSVKLFAPPSGAIGNNMFNVCEEIDYKVIMWSRDTIDWRDQDTALILSRATKNLAAGDLILMHPTAASTEILPKILEYIKSVGLTASTVSETISA